MFFVHFILSWPAHDSFDSPPTFLLVIKGKKKSFFFVSTKPQLGQPQAPPSSTLRQISASMQKSGSGYGSWHYLLSPSWAERCWYHNIWSKVKRTQKTAQTSNHNKITEKWMNECCAALILIAAILCISCKITWFSRSSSGSDNNTTCYYSVGFFLIWLRCPIPLIDQ